MASVILHPQAASVHHSGSLTLHGPSSVMEPQWVASDFDWDPRSLAVLEGEQAFPALPQPQSHSDGRLSSAQVQGPGPG